LTVGRFAWGIVLIVVFSLALVARAPARLLGLVVPAAQLQLDGLAGTVWNGTASRCVLRLPQGALHLGAVRWSLHPTSLLSLSPRLDVASHWGAQRLEGEVRFGLGGDIALRDLEARVPAELVQRFAPLAVDGDLSAQIAELELRDGLPHRADGRLVWEDAGFQSPRGRIPLGTYALDVRQPPGEVLIGEVLTLAGDLRAQGRAELDGRRYSIDIGLVGEAPLDPILSNSLSLMAAPDDAGGYRILLDGAF
jgi:hypothetical protein